MKTRSRTAAFSTAGAVRATHPSAIGRTSEIKTEAKQTVQFGGVAVPDTPLPARSCPDASKVVHPSATASPGWLEPVPQPVQLQQPQQLLHQKAPGPAAVSSGRRPRTTLEVATPAKRQRTTPGTGSRLDQLLSDIGLPNKPESPWLQQLLTPPQSQPRRRRLSVGSVSAQPTNKVLDFPCLGSNNVLHDPLPPC